MPSFQTRQKPLPQLYAFLKKTMSPACIWRFHTIRCSATPEGQNHLDTEHAAGIDIEKLPTLKKPWSTICGNLKRSDKTYEQCLSEITQRTQAMLIKLHRGEYIVTLLTACGDDFKSNIEGNESGCSLFVYSHYPQNRCSTCALIFAFEMTRIYSRP